MRLVGAQKAAKVADLPHDVFMREVAAEHVSAFKRCGISAGSERGVMLALRRKTPWSASGAYRDRTDDLRLAKPKWLKRRVAGSGGDSAHLQPVSALGGPGVAGTRGTLRVGLAGSARDGFPWRTRPASLLSPADHVAMLESLVATVEAFDLVGAVA